MQQTKKTTTTTPSDRFHKQQAQKQHRMYKQQQQQLEQQQQQQQMMQPQQQQQPQQQTFKPAEAAQPPQNIVRLKIGSEYTGAEWPPPLSWLQENHPDVMRQVLRDDQNGTQWKEKGTNKTVASIFGTSQQQQQQPQPQIQPQQQQLQQQPKEQKHQNDDNNNNGKPFLLYYNGVNRNTCKLTNELLSLMQSSPVLQQLVNTQDCMVNYPMLIVFGSEPLERYPSEKSLQKLKQIVGQQQQPQPQQEIHGIESSQRGYGNRSASVHSIAGLQPMSPQQERLHMARYGIVDGGLSLEQQLFQQQHPRLQQQQQQAQPPQQQQQAMTWTPQQQQHQLLPQQQQQAWGQHQQQPQQQAWGQQQQPQQQAWGQQQQPQQQAWGQQQQPQQQAWVQQQQAWGQQPQQQQQHEW